MSLNYTEKFSRVIAVSAALVLAIAANNAWSMEAQVEAGASTSTSAEASNNAVETDTRASARGDVRIERKQQEGEPSQDVDGESDVNDVETPDAGPVMAEGKAIAIGTIEAGSNITADAQAAAGATADELQESAAANVSGDVAASLEAAVSDEIRTSIQQDLVTDLTDSLSLPGSD